MPTGVGEETIYDSGDVPHVKGGRCNAARARIPLLLRQSVHDLEDTLAHLKKNVRDGLGEWGGARGGGRGGPPRVGPARPHAVFAIDPQLALWLAIGRPSISPRPLMIPPAVVYR